MPRLGVTEQTAVVRRNVQEIARSLLDDDGLPPPSRCRVVVVLMGLPGSGKSHFGRLLAARRGAVVVASDALRRRLFVAPSYARSETRTVFAIAHAMTRMLLAEGRTVIFDATNLRERDRGPLYALAREAEAGLVLVRVTAPEPVIHERLAGRLARVAPEDASDADLRVYEVMRERFEEPSRPYLATDSSADLSAELARVAEAVRAACE